MHDIYAQACHPSGASSSLPNCMLWSQGLPTLCPLLTALPQGLRDFLLFHPIRFYALKWQSSISKSAPHVMNEPKHIWMSPIRLVCVQESTDSPWQKKGGLIIFSSHIPCGQDAVENFQLFHILGELHSNSVQPIPNFLFHICSFLILTQTNP